MSDAYVVQDRRPIRAREQRWAQRVSSFLARRKVSPNLISMFGCFAAIAGGVLLSCTRFASPAVARNCFLATALLIQVRLLANLLDGMVAIETHSASRLGELFNEVPDRVSDAALFIGAGYASGTHVWLGYIAACVALFVAYVRAIGKGMTGVQDFSGPMAKPQRMFVLTCACVWLALLPGSWSKPLGVGFLDIALAIIAVGGLLTACRRLASTARKLSAIC